jgi:hypothetical protein
MSGLRAQRRVALWLCALSGSWACGSGQRAQRANTRGRHDASANGAVVSTVNSNEITLSEVQDLALAGLPSAGALHRLQSQSLLMAEAERRGFERDPYVEQVRRQAAVQALLESEANAVRVDDAQIRELYAHDKSRFETPERRASVHVLARVPKNASHEVDAQAEAIVQALIGPLGAASDLAAFLQEQKGHSLAGLPLVAERLPALDREAHIAKPYLDALFEPSRPSVVPKPVRSSYGWHAIRVTAIEPAVAKISYDEVREQLRSELLLRDRTQRVEALVRGMRKEVSVEIAPAAPAILARMAIE